MATVTDIENAILAVLQDDTSLKTYVKQWEILPDLDEDTILAVMINFPAVGVCAVGGRYDENATGQVDETGQFSILCVNKNLRSAAAGLTGKVISEEDEIVEKGAFDLVNDVRACLSPLGALNTEESSVMDNRVVSWQLLGADKNIAVAGVDVEVIWRHTI